MNRIKNLLDRIPDDASRAIVASWMKKNLIECGQVFIVSHEILQRDQKAKEWGTHTLRDKFASAIAERLEIEERWRPVHMNLSLSSEEVASIPPSMPKDLELRGTIWVLKGLK